MLDSLLPVSGGREYIANISGFISAPRERRTTRDGQYFFVNQRFVRDKTIAGGLLEGYRSVLPHGVYPVAFLFLDIPLEEIDVNVHPAKTEVRFRRTEAVKEVIAEAVRQALAKAGVVTAVEPGDLDRDVYVPPVVREEVLEQPRIDFHAPHQPDPERVPDETVPVNADGANTVTEERVDADQFLGEIISADFERSAQTRAAGTFSADIAGTPASAGVDDATAAGYAVLPPVNSAEKVAKAVEVESLSSSKIRPIAQLHDSFIIAVDDEGLLLIDQHVAHERILFDKFRKQETERQIESQNLLLPETIDLTPAQSEAYQIVEAELESLGFGLMRLSGRTVAIKSVPTDLPPSEVRNLLAEILDTVESEKRGNAKSTLRNDIAASLACKAAVKINMKLTLEKMQWLIDRLLITSSPTTCPHGRPVILRLTMKDIERGFHRT
jgi:DNA mismatch repair protein MutL